MLGKAGFIDDTLDAAELFDDDLYGVHVLNVTENRYQPQAPLMPIFLGARIFRPLHKSAMDFAFDIAAVKEAMRAQGVSQETLASRAGMTHKSAIAKIFNGTRSVKLSEAARIYDVLQLNPISSTGVQTVPIIGFASAGNWREAVEMPIGRMVIPNRVAGPRAFAIQVKGDSIDQLVADGGWVVVDPDDKALAGGKVYLIQNGEYETTVKRYQRTPARFEPVSSNADHQSFLASDCDFVVLGRVVWKGEAL